MVCTPSSYQGRRSQLRGKATNVPGSIGFSPLSNISLLSLLNRYLCFCKWRWCDLNTKRFIIKPSSQANSFPVQDLVTVNWDEQHPNPNQLRWKPFSLPQSGEKVLHLLMALATKMYSADKWKFEIHKNSLKNSHFSQRLILWTVSARWLGQGRPEPDMAWQSTSLPATQGDAWKMKSSV